MPISLFSETGDEQAEDPINNYLNYFLTVRVQLEMQ